MKMLLPAASWLQTHGYSGLIAAMHKDPDAFVHIPQKRLNHTAKDDVALAERLARDNGGKIPNHKWLVSHGYSGLDNRIRYRDPHLFAHLEQQRPRQTDEEVVASAEKLAKQNGGVIPNSWWLIKNGFHRINGRIRSKPHLFTHLKQWIPCNLIKYILFECRGFHAA